MAFPHKKNASKSLLIIKFYHISSFNFKIGWEKHKKKPITCVQDADIFTEVVTFNVWNEEKHMELHNEVFMDWFQH